MHKNLSRAQIFVYTTHTVQSSPLHLPPAHTLPNRSRETENPGRALPQAPHLELQFGGQGHSTSGGTPGVSQICWPGLDKLCSPGRCRAAAQLWLSPSCALQLEPFNPAAPQGFQENPELGQLGAGTRHLLLADICHLLCEKPQLAACRALL